MHFTGSANGVARDVAVLFDNADGRVFVKVEHLGTWLTTDALDGLIDALTEWRDRYKERTRAASRRRKAKGA